MDAKTEEAARKYAEPLADSLCFGDSPMTRARIHAFVKGAEWKEQQLIGMVTSYLQENIAKDFCFNEELREMVPDCIESLRQAITTKEN